MPRRQGTRLGLFALLVSGCIGVVPQAGGGRPRAAKPRQAKGIAGEAAYAGPDKAISKHNLLANATFNDGSSLPWMTSFTAPGDGTAEIVDGALCLTVTNKGANAWDAQLRHREMTIERRHRYKVSFRAYASQPIKMRAKVGMQGPPYAEYWVDTLKLDRTPRTFTGSFSMEKANDPTAEFAFHVGGSLAYGTKGPYTVCIDDVRLEDPRFVRGGGEAKKQLPALLVNQTGYFPGLVKLAVLRSDAKDPQPWKLVDGSGKELLSGRSQPVGPDAPSGDSVHVIDFSAFEGEGTGLVLQSGSERSHPFDVRPDIYRRLKYDALAYFYHNRSGIPITLPYAGRQDLTRPAGHLSDKSVPCAPGAGCNYKLDLAGGWYDAGDHGKYVVNGGISVWTLLNLYERTKHLGSSLADFADGRMNIPEKGNGVPDLLDEARWQMEFMLKMQVPEGEKLAGMVHHKMHDKEWTALGLAPHEDPMPRLVYAPSTAATLNLAATAAQAARIWQKIDAAFSARCLKAAERAFQAARQHPAQFASAGGVGGGPYDDKNVDDEFYWAAAELYVTTGKAEYKDFFSKSRYALKVPKRLGEGTEAGIASPMTWQNTEALGTISLAVAPSALPRGEVQAVRQAVIETADTYLAIIKERGYRVPIEYGSKNQAPWGSNSFIINNLVALGLAHDFTGQAKYLNGVVAGMDYIMGRNALDQSYVTGYGERPLENPHHRFWAYQSNNKYPRAPAGCVSGGPNSALQDPYAKAAGIAGCPPEKCFIDHIESWSTNEITINWNAPFAWALAFLDEKGGTTAKGAPAAKQKRPTASR